ncbi:MAG: hypothetical protein ABW007_19180 [Chitinophagaceae bacterium]
MTHEEIKHALIGIIYERLCRKAFLTGNFCEEITAELVSKGMSPDQLDVSRIDYDVHFSTRRLYVYVQVQENPQMLDSISKSFDELEMLRTLSITVEHTTPALELVRAEREKQFAMGRHTMFDVSRNREGQLSSAGAQYAIACNELRRMRAENLVSDSTKLMVLQDLPKRTDSLCPIDWWPEWWKPSLDRKEMLTKAVALLIAELDREIALEKGPPVTFTASIDKEALRKTYPDLEV